MRVFCFGLSSAKILVILAPITYISRPQNQRNMMTKNDILEKLQQTRQQALAKYSGFHVAALLETTTGEFFNGFNIESSSYGLTICAERVALFKALTEGHRNFQRIFIMADGEQPCPPCGACRQVLMDYAPDIEVIMLSETGVEQRMNINQLLPLAFRDDRLK